MEPIRNNSEETVEEMAKLFEEDASMETSTARTPWFFIRCHVKGRPAPDLAHTVMVEKPKRWSMSQCMQALQARAISILNLAMIALLKTARDVGYCYVTSPESIGTAVFGKRQDNSIVPIDALILDPDQCLVTEEHLQGQPILLRTIDVYIYATPYKKELSPAQAINEFEREHAGFLQELIQLPVFAARHLQNNEVRIPTVRITREAEEPPVATPPAVQQPKVTNQQSTSTKKRRNGSANGNPQQQPQPVVTTAYQTIVPQAILAAQPPRPQQGVSRVTEWRKLFQAK